MNKIAGQVKAYAVLEKDENTGGIYFASRAIEAHKAGANEYGDGELSYVQCRRAPWADIYADTALVPARDAVAHGWRFECSGCGILINEDMEHESRKPIDRVCGYMGGMVYCSPRCKWSRMKEEARRNAAESAVIEMLCGVVLRRFPDAVFPSVTDGRWGPHHAYVTRQHGTGFWHLRQAAVSFEFPGMAIGPAHFRVEDRHKIGPPHAYYMCCNAEAIRLSGLELTRTHLLSNRAQRLTG